MNARSNDNPLAGLIGFVFIIGIVIIITIIEDKREKKRRKEISDYCIKNDLVYSESVDIPATATRFSLVNNSGHSVEYYAGMSGIRGDYDFIVFDYHYATGSGKGRHDYYHTICVVSNVNFKMPQFFIRDENFILDSLGKLFGGQDINFTSDPKFSKMFVLQGKSEPLVREFFDDRIRTAFVNNHISGYKYEGNKDCLMICAPKMLSLKDRIILLAKAMSIYLEVEKNQNREFV